MRPQKDVRGADLVPGARVAYNISGDVALGTIIDAKPGHFKIELLHDAAGMPALHVSRVRNARSILVLRNGDLP
jgi:hypothetical protein